MQTNEVGYLSLTSSIIPDNKPTVINFIMGGYFLHGILFL